MKIDLEYMVRRFGLLMKKECPEYSEEIDKIYKEMYNDKWAWRIYGGIGFTGWVTHEGKEIVC